MFCACMPFYQFSAVRQVIGEGDKPNLKCHEESCGGAVLTQSSQYHANQHAGYHHKLSFKIAALSKKRTGAERNIVNMFKKQRPPTAPPTPITAQIRNMATTPRNRMSRPTCQPVAFDASQVQDTGHVEMSCDTTFSGDQARHHAARHIEFGRADLHDSKFRPLRAMCSILCGSVHCWPCITSRVHCWFNCESKDHQSSGSLQVAWRLAKDIWQLEASSELHN